MSTLKRERVRPMREIMVMFEKTVLLTGRLVAGCAIVSNAEHRGKTLMRAEADQSIDNHWAGLARQVLKKRFPLFIRLTIEGRVD